MPWANDGLKRQIASPIGSSNLEWDAALPLVLERVALFGATAAQEGCRFALEPLPGVRDGMGDLLNAFDFVR